MEEDLWLNQLAELNKNDPLYEQKRDHQFRSHQAQLNREHEIAKMHLQAQLQKEAEKRNRGGSGLGKLLGKLGGSALSLIPGLGPVASFASPILGGLGSVLEGKIGGNLAGLGAWDAVADTIQTDFAAMLDKIKKEKKAKRNERRLKGRGNRYTGGGAGRGLLRGSTGGAIEEFYS